MRQIHWKAAARTEELTVKEFEGTVSANLHLDIENVPGSTGVDYRSFAFGCWKPRRPASVTV